MGVRHQFQLLSACLELILLVTESELHHVNGYQTLLSSNKIKWFQKSFEDYINIRDIVSLLVVDLFI